MAATYSPVLWNRQKRIYDTVVAALGLIYLAVFILVTLTFNKDVTAETLIIRSTGTLAILMLHVILLTGPLARINTRFLPLLYNRRHLGVSMFVVAAIHGVFSIIQFHSLGNVHPILSLFLSNTHYVSISKFPFEVFGFFALIILFLMAATSHDFWLHNLSPHVWKSLHMLVYLAYCLLILHVMLGVIQYETSPVLTVLLGVGMSAIIALHIVAGRRERKADHAIESATVEGYKKACPVGEIANNRAKVVTFGDERIAIFKYDNKISAISNVCKHQNGPLGEGKIVDGCVTCPWHGYQYLPHNGCSPPPFHEKVSTYDVKIIGKDVWINPLPYPEGSQRTPALIDGIK